MNKKIIVIFLLAGIFLLCGTTLCLVLLPEKEPTEGNNTTTSKPLSTKIIPKPTKEETQTSDPIVTKSTPSTAKEDTTTIKTGYTMITKSIEKPIIYIYPEKDMDVEIKLGFKEYLTVSYPKFIDGWKVLAKKNGTLIDKTTNRELYALYYESQNIYDYNMTDTGFVIKGSDSIQFLEKVLPTLGLNAKETEEFIIYWLPKLESNKYNYIRFINPAEINKNTPLKITPKPESLIRVLMVFKGLDKPINVKEQKLTTPIRKGYTVVEWGGTEIK